ncbi:hypothetical protein [Deinococcus radiopugnans]
MGVAAMVRESISARSPNSWRVCEVSEAYCTAARISISRVNTVT